MTTILWSSIYIPAVKQKFVLSALNTIHLSAGYQAYNPYPGGTGTPAGITERVRLFVARPEANWIRIIGEPNPTLLPPLANQLQAPLLYAWISDSDSHVDVIGESSLKQFLRPGKTEADFGDFTPAAQPSEGVFDDLAREHGVDATQAEKLIQKTTQTFFKKLNKQTQGEAGKLQNAALESITAGQFSWNIPAAQRLQGIMNCLTVPSNWREPDYRDLAAAYQIACLLDIDEYAPLLPGDEASLDKVAYPLDYALAYYAK